MRQAHHSLRAPGGNIQSMHCRDDMVHECERQTSRASRRSCSILPEETTSSTLSLSTRLLASPTIVSRKLLGMSFLLGFTDSTVRLGQISDGNVYIGSGAYNAGVVLRCGTS
jgi:hypothetical protein